LTVSLIKAWLQPTEDPEKVAHAIKNIFGELDLEVNAKTSTISAKLDGLEKLAVFRDKIAQDRIRDTLKKVFTRWKNENGLSFGLNRQAAYVGHVSINLENEDPMGPIQVNINGDIDSVINYLCDRSR
jgi:predicted RNA binding protein with dsRBD fold (UPF0201 family)